MSECRGNTIYYYILSSSFKLLLLHWTGHKLSKAIFNANEEGTHVFCTNKRLKSSSYPIPTKNCNFCPIDIIVCNK